MGMLLIIYYEQDIELVTMKEVRNDQPAFGADAQRLKRELSDQIQLTSSFTNN
jgi:hypothetical protein